MGLLSFLTAATGLLGLVPIASADIHCRYVEAGPEGPAGNRLVIRAGKFEESVAVMPGSEQSIRVVNDRLVSDVTCKGGEPSMVNVDRIDFLVAPRAAGSTIYVVDAPEFGPGATPAEAGGKGISFLAAGPAVTFGVGGTEGPDRIWMGMKGKAVAVDFSPDPQVAPRSPRSIDARIFARFTNLLVRAGAGDDDVRGARIPRVANPFDRPLLASSSLYGDGGRDILVGGWSMDFIDAGPGNDLVSGAAGDDQIIGGPGIDVLGGGRGADRIDAADGGVPDLVRCGKDRDFARLDLVDRARGCERFRFVDQQVRIRRR